MSTEDLERPSNNSAAEALKTALYNEQQRLAYWESTHSLNLRAVLLSDKALESQREATQKAVERLIAHSRPVGVTGL